MSRRRKEDEGIDLFAFQDIVTGTTGILIVITLLMSLTIGANRIERVLNERQEDASTQQEQSELHAKHEALLQEFNIRQTLSEQIEKRKAQLAEYLQADVEALEQEKIPNPASDKQRRLIPPTSASLRKPLTAVASEKYFELLEDDGTLRRRLDYSIGNLNLQEALLSELEDTHDGYLFLIKPSAFPYAANIIYLGIRNNALLFPFSYDLIPEDWKVSLR
jgi:hypothetical protein